MRELLKTIGIACVIGTLVALAIMLAGCTEDMPKRATLELGANAECGLLASRLDVTIPEHVEHGTCVLTARWGEDGELRVDDVCANGQAMRCAVSPDDGGSCYWTATGAKLCWFDARVSQPN